MSKIIPRNIKLQPTPKQVDGPYFLADAPFARSAVPQGASGDLLRLRGQVLSQDGLPIAGAVVHFWLADTKGVYDNQDATGAVVQIKPENYRNRVRVKTSAQGRYSFECLRPGNYPLGADTRAAVRPGHIHVQVDAEGFDQLITQLYFQDDAYNVKDIPGEDFFQPELAIQLDPAMPAAGKIQRGVFNLVLVRS